MPTQAEVSGATPAARRLRPVLPVGNGEQLDAIAIWVFNLDADEA
jgi:hypothetical protein